MPLLFELYVLSTYEREDSPDLSQCESGNHKYSIAISINGLHLPFIEPQLFGESTMSFFFYPLVRANLPTYLRGNDSLMTTVSRQTFSSQRVVIIGAKNLWSDFCFVMNSVFHFFFLQSSL
jgi:hypothetical protein